MIFRTGDLGSLRVLRHTVPWAQRLLLVFKPSDVDRLRRDDGVLSMLDGVGVRDRLLTASAHAWLESRGMRTFAWTVNDEERMNELVRRGLDGLITDASTSWR